ncbi:ABC transporter permease [Arthrobacter echini]|uniref:ABC transporter permease n=1 Tax=Arthrobacter echini TaxID=1529066 RepID=A0A4S5E8U3_9MICC|nr:ABC transporter permease subunit [Arthrobacter echini]THJ67972.1 ABC transporter permease [Arthrobacter echini]
MPILIQFLRAGARNLLIWAVALVAVMAMYLSFYPSLGGAASGMTELVDQLPEGMVKAIGYDQIATGAGYAQSTFFGLLGFFLGTAAAVAWGTRAVAGDEESGMLELTLAHPVSRLQLVTERTLAILTRLTVLGVVLGLALAAMSGPFDLGLEGSHIVAVVAAWVLLTFTIAMAALMGGAVFGSRVAALGIGAGVGVVAFLLNALGAQSEENAWMSDISPFSWAYGERPLAQGWDGGGLGLLAALAAVFVATALLAFARRDLRS